MAKNRLPVHPAEERLIQPLWNADPIVWRWHCEHVGVPYSINQSVICMGIVKKDEIIGSVIYHRYRWPDIEIGIETTDPAWCNRRILKSIFDFPFNQLGCKRVTAITDPAKPAVCNFIERLGFVYEGRLRDSLPHGDSIILGMKRDECRWI